MSDAESTWSFTDVAAEHHFILGPAGFSFVPVGEDDQEERFRVVGWCEAESFRAWLINEHGCHLALRCEDA